MSFGKLETPPFRVGLGTDIHRLVPGDGVWLGGVRIPCLFCAEAVSDGDVLLHALVDALLGACGWGDIGEWFPEDSVERGCASSVFVAAVVMRLRKEGVGIVNIDATVDMEAVRLSPWKAAMRERVAGLLGIPADRVGIKAKTAEGLGAIGAGEAVAAQVVALLGSVKETETP